MGSLGYYLLLYFGKNLARDDFDDINVVIYWSNFLSTDITDRV